MNKNPVLIFVFLFLSCLAGAQNTYPRDYFRSPVDTTLALAGNFGEIRPNHFHAGFDVKTNGREGMPIYAAADGYISRIKLSPYGYGKSLYIVHPNGYTSVYGHLKSFEPLIAQFAKAVQYSLSSNEIDTLLNPNSLPVRKGQFIGFSGNTGGSQGPHLHFEIRETKTEQPVNPYYFGYKIEDTSRPKITAIAIYPLSGTSSVNGKHSIKKLKPSVANGKYFLSKTDSITVNGLIGFGIETYDTENRSSNQNGVFSIELQSGGKRIYYHELEKFSFENARYVNTHIDYEEKQKHNNKIQKCFLSKNNKLTIYKDVINNGILNFTDDSIHWIRYIVKDFQGNTSELMLKVRSTSKIKVVAALVEPTEPVFDCSKENNFQKEDLQLTFPANAFYDDVAFKYKKSPQSKGTYSALHKIMSPNVALQKAYTLSIKPDYIPEKLHSKVCIVAVNEKGGRSYEGGMYKEGMVTTKTKNFGTFAIATDTVPPKIRTLFKYTKEAAVDLSHATTINVIATDNLSGIKKYTAKIDGNWVPCEYEFKKDLIFYTFGDFLADRVHTFEITVTDDKENSSTLLFTFKR